MISNAVRPASTARSRKVTSPERGRASISCRFIPASFFIALLVNIGGRGAKTLDGFVTENAAKHTSKPIGPHPDPLFGRNEILANLKQDIGHASALGMNGSAVVSLERNAIWLVFTDRQIR